MSNKSNGTAFEREFAEILFRHGFWAHRMQDNQNGQPFDIIAAKNRVPYAFDCKDCQGSIFKFSRIEENQMLAMQLWRQSGNGNAFLAIRMPETGIRILPYSVAIELMEKGTLSIAEGALLRLTPSLHEWLKVVDK